MNQKDAKKMLEELFKKRMNWDERSMIRYKGERLSMSDVQVLEMYLEQIIRRGEIPSEIKVFSPTLKRILGITS